MTSNAVLLICSPWSSKFRIPTEVDISLPSKCTLNLAVLKPTPLVHHLWVSLTIHRWDSLITTDTIPTLNLNLGNKQPINSRLNTKMETTTGKIE